MRTRVDCKRHISATLCFTWAGSSHRTERGSIMNHPQAIWRAVRGNLNIWLLQNTRGSAPTASHMRKTWRANRERAASPALFHFFHDVWKNLIIMISVWVYLMHLFNYQSTDLALTISGLIFCSYVFMILLFIIFLYSALYAQQLKSIPFFYPIEKDIKVFTHKLFHLDLCVFEVQ